MEALVVGVNIGSDNFCDSFKFDYRVCDHLNLNLESNTLVSVIALTKVKGLNYKGLKWIVKKLDVKQNWLGTRNKSTGPIEISLRDGQILVIVNSNF